MIRKFQKTDTEQIMEIWLDGNIDAHPFIPKEYWLSNFETVCEQLLQAEVYVFENDGNIQGFIGIQENHIAGIFVKQSFRSTGIGKHLLDYAKATHSVLTLNVYQKNYRAVEFYLREGFNLITEGIESESGEVDETMCWYPSEK